MVTPIYKYLLFYLKKKKNSFYDYESYGFIFFLLDQILIIKINLLLKYF